MNFFFYTELKTKSKNKILNLVFQFIKKTMALWVHEFNRSFIAFFNPEVEFLHACLYQQQCEESQRKNTLSIIDF